MHAVLVARGGKLVFERYFRGPTRSDGRRVENVTFDADTLHDMKSVSKSVASLALGIAIDRGLIRSVDEPIFSFFPELSDLRSPEKDRIQLVHALTMSMGLTWVEATPATGDDNNDEARMHMASDPCRYVLGLAVTAPAGQEFFYNTGALTLVSAIIRKATGRPLDEFARRNVVRAYGHHRRGVDRRQGGYRCRRGIALATARHGENRPTRPRGRSLERPPDRLEGLDRDLDSTEDRQANGAMDLYGYLWWLGRSRINGREIHWVGALGRGGQSIRIVPELDLVVVVTAGYYQDYSPQAFQVQYGIFRDVLRAIPPPG